MTQDTDCVVPMVMVLVSRVVLMYLHIGSCNTACRDTGADIPVQPRV